MRKTSLHITSSWFTTFFECFIAYIFLRDLAYTYLPFDPSIFKTEIGYFVSLFTGWNFLIVILIITFSLWWNTQEKKAKFNSAGLHDLLHSIIYYYASFLIFQYGFAKVYNMQFHHSYYRDDSLSGNLSGFAVAWNFFNYSYYYTLLIGILQIAGGVLLLFFKTRLAAALLLLPVMMNILLINMFYGISPDAFVNAILITITLTFVLWQHRKKLLSLFFNKPSGSSSGKMYFIKAALRIIVVVFAFSAGYPYKENITIYTGKWKIAQLNRNGKLVDLQKWQTDSTAWNNVYVEANNILYFSANPNYYDYSKKHIITYKYKLVKNRLLLAKYAYPYKELTDSATVFVHRYSPTRMQWNTIIHGDTLQMELQRDTLK